MGTLTAEMVVEHMANGLVLGALYIILALGVWIILGLLGFVNFAHGAMYTLGGYAAMEVGKRLGFWPGLVISPIIVGILGMIVEATIMRRFYREIPELSLLFTFGLAMFIEQVLRIVWGPASYNISPPVEISGPLLIGAFRYSRYRVFSLVIILLVVIALWWFLERTRFGTIIRAGSRDPEMVQVLGINLAPVFTFVFGLGVAMAALAGLLASPLGQVEPAMGNAVGMAAFVVVVIGGIGSFWGVILSGLLVGEVVGVMKLLWAPASEASMYVLMALVLLLRPRGLFGERWARFE